MINLTWGNLRNQEFMASLGKLYSKPMSYAEGMRFALVGREIKKQQVLCEETHLGILKKYGIPDKDKPDVFQIPDAQRETYAAEMKKLDGHSFTVNVSRFDALKLSDVVEFSPQDLMLLEPLMLPFEIPSEPLAPTNNVADNKPQSPPPSH